MFEYNDEFKKNVGDFILSFSQMEFTIGRLITILENGVSYNKVDRENHSLELNRKKKKLSKLLESNKILFDKWKKIETKISDCNQFRRGITHGVVMNFISTSPIKILVSHKKGFRYFNLTNELVQENNKLLSDINTGGSWFRTIKTGYY